ncbi:MAG: ATP-binding protein [Desulfohalobiaceae bacterium]|nr:ATP-binding protein [Desulfohalobiaceae bacterium]
MPTKRVHMPSRRREQTGNAYLLESALDKNDCFVLRQACIYLLRLIARFPMLDREILEFAFWVIGPDVAQLNQKLLEYSTKKEAERLRDDLDDCLDFDDHARVLMKAVKQDKKKASKLLDNMLRILERRKKQMKSANLSQLKYNSRKFRELFSLSEDEMELCLLLFLINSWDRFRHLFKSHLSIEEFSGRKYLLALLGITSSNLEKLLQGRLSKLGIISKSEAGLDLNDEFLALFMDPEHHVGPGSFYKRPQDSDIPLSYHLIPHKEVQFISSLLREKGPLPTHVLLYGPAGTGKTSFARALAASLPDPAYEILQDNRNESRKRRAALQACLNMTNNGGGSVMIIDEADNLLNTGGKFFFRGEIRDKGWLNAFMEEPGVRAIWIVNEAEEMEESVLRRFSYSLYFPRFSRQKRGQLWKTITRHNKAGNLLKSRSIQNLARDYNVSAGVMDLAVKQAMRSSQKQGLSFEQRVRMALDAHLRLTNGGMLPKKQNSIDGGFNLKGLNIRGNLDRVLQQLRTFDGKVRQGGKQPISQYNLLFYGPPGTGKSEMAKYLAKDLDRDLLIKKSSDLLDKYVGETEKNIAAMFSEAEEKEAVLVVDEADSFIFGRDMSQRSWEVTMVNEFMTQMESYQGILICTTNRFLGMDRASVRRFHHKLFFDFLDPEGVEIFYREFLAGLCTDAIEPSLMKRLIGLDKLTPGDFRNVRDVYAMSEDGLTHEILVSALEEEMRLKEKQEGAVRMGF